MKKCIPSMIAVITLMLCMPASAISADDGPTGKDKKDVYDRTSTDITATFKKFMECNAGDRSHTACTTDFAAPYFHFDYAAIEKLRKHHIIMLPGGDFDAFSELVTLCEEERSEDLETFFNRYPFFGAEIKTSVEKEVCPDYLNKTEQYYDKYMNAYSTYEQFFGAHDIPFTRLQFSKDKSPIFIGDRADKVSLLANTIDSLEAQYGDNSSKDYILIGHSFGGLNVTDFLMEIAGAHVPGTPEDKLFADTTARLWPAEKKERIFKKIKGVGLLNTFLQGKRDSEESLRTIAQENNIQADDVLEFYIKRVLENYADEEFETDNATLNNIYHLVMRSNRYRGNYYLQDKNAAAPKNGTPVKDAIDRIANEKAVIAVGCYVPRLLPDFFVQPNFIVHLSKKKWRDSGIRNDGMVETYATILPRQSAEFVLLPNTDHGTLVLKPQVSGISQGHHYDQMPFIKTLFTRMMTKIDELPAAN